MTAVRQKRASVLGAGPEATELETALYFFPEVEVVSSLDLISNDGIPRSRDALDLAIVCPPAASLETCAQLLASGTDLWILPPMAANPDQADRLESLAELGGRTLMTRSPSAFAPIWSRVARELEAGSIGHLQRVEWRVGKRPGARPEALELEAALIALDVFECLAGPLDALRGTWVEAGGTPHGVRLEARHARSDRVSVCLGSGAGGEAAELRCHGSEGEIRVGGFQGVLQSASGPRPLGPGPARARGYTEGIGELLRRSGALPVEDRGALLLRGLTQALLDAGSWQLI